MTSSKPIQSLSLLRIEKEEAPIAASFAGTLRAFSRKQQQGPPRARPSLAALAAKTKPLKPPRSLLKGLDRNPNKSSSAGDLPALAGKESPDRKPTRLQSLPHLLRVWKWLQKQNAFSTKKQLRVSDTVSLGEKRFIALVHVEGQKFLIGGGASGVSLLAELNNEVELDTDSTLDAEPESGVLQPIACAGGRST